LVTDSSVEEAAVAQ